MYDYQQVYKASLEYFKGDELAASVFAGKYALQDTEGNYIELTPDDMHSRIASEFAAISAGSPPAAATILSRGSQIALITPIAWA